MQALGAPTYTFGLWSRDFDDQSRIFISQKIRRSVPSDVDVFGLTDKELTNSSPSQTFHVAEIVQATATKEIIKITKFSIKTNEAFRLFSIISVL